MVRIALGEPIEEIQPKIDLKEYLLKVDKNLHDEIIKADDRFFLRGIF